MNLDTPCPECVNKTAAGAPPDFTGSATDHCPHRLVGYVLHFDGGRLTRWSAGPMTAAEVEERNRLVRRELFRQQGLKPVK